METKAPKKLYNPKKHFQELLSSEFYSFNKRGCLADNEIYDCSLKRRSEEEAFNQTNQNQTFRIYRRGLAFSILKKVKQDKPNGLIEICKEDKVNLLRKGFKKFFELDYHKLSEGKLSVGEKICHPFDWILADESFKVFCSVKEDGENAQLTYSSKLQSFIVSSKNVSIVTNIMKKEDKERYKDTPHVLEIAEWFTNKIARMEPEQRDCLKELLETNTIVGEFILPGKFTHIIKNKENGFKCFSLIRKKNFVKEWIDLDAAEMTLRGFGFDFVKFETHKLDRIGVINLLKRLADKCANEDLEDIKEGFVIYIQGETEQFMIKLKSLAYKLSKLEEGLKGTLSKKIEENKISLIPMVSRCKYDREEFKVSYLNGNQIQQLMDLNLPNDDLKQVLKLFDNQIKLLNERIQCFKPFLKHSSKFIQLDFFNKLLYHVSTFELEKKEQLITSSFNLSLQHKKPIFVFIPLSIPCSGKSEYGKKVISILAEELNYSYRMVSSDDVKGKLIEEYMILNPNMTLEKAHNNVSKKAAKRVDEMFREFMIAAKEDKDRKDGYIIFRDKNHPNCKSLDTVIADTNLHLHDTNFKVILMVPKKKRFLNQGISYEDLIKCTLRLKRREKHNTLTYQGFETFTNVMCNFYSAFRMRFNSDIKEEDMVEYFIDENVTEDSKKAFEELIEVVKDYMYLKRGKKPLKPYQYGKLKERFNNSIDNNKLAPLDYETINTIMKEDLKKKLLNKL